MQLLYLRAEHSCGHRWGEKCRFAEALDWPAETGRGWIEREQTDSEKALNPQCCLG